MGDNNICFSFAIRVSPTSTQLTDKICPVVYLVGEWFCSAYTVCDEENVGYTHIHVHIISEYVVEITDDYMQMKF